MSNLVFLWLSFWKRNKKRFFIVPIFIAQVTFIVSPFINPSRAEAAVGAPALLNHQGRLMDSSGALLGGSSGTNYCFKFSFYDDASVGGLDTRLWPSAAPQKMTLLVKNGVFNAAIGDVAAGGDLLDFDFNSTDEAYLNIEVANSSGGSCVGVSSFENLSPRQRITSAGYAMNANSLKGFTPSQTPTGNQIPVLNAGDLSLAGAITSGGLTLGTGSAATGILNLKNATNSNTLSVQAGVTTTPYTLTLPTDSGTIGQFLQTDGTGATSWATIGGGGDALVGNPLSQFAATTSLQLAGVITDETGSGALVFANSPTLTTPNIGAATATTVNGLTITSSTGTLSIANGKTLTSSNTLTLAGTDGSTLNIGTGGTLGTAAYTSAGAYAAALGADDNYVTDAQLVVIGNTSGTNTGDQDLSPYLLISGLTAAETDPIFAASNAFSISAGDITNLGNLSGINTGDNATNTQYASDYRAANFIAGTNYLTPTGSAAGLTSFPTLNQNTTGNAATATALATPRTINGVSFDGTANIVVADATRVLANSAITGATKTKITYDAKGLVTSGADATTADIADSLNKRYVTDAGLTVLGNTSGTNTGDQTITLTGDVTGSGTGSFATTIANDAVTFAKIQNITDNRILGRSAGTAGDAQELTIGSGLSLAGGVLSATVTSYTDEQAQDAVGGALSAEFTYNDIANTIAINSIDWSKVAGTPTTFSGYGISDTSANLKTAITDETGSGALVFANTPTFVTPVLGAATATSVNGLTITPSTGTLSVANGKTLTSSNTLTLAGTDGSTLNIGAGGTLGTAAFTAASDYLTPTGSAAGLTSFPTLNQNTTGNAATATALATPRTINGVSFDGTGNITVADATRVLANAAITGATKTKITYDAKGLVTAGADATTADIADSLNKRYVTDAGLTVLGNTSGTNTGDQTISDATISLSDIVTNNFSTTQHGFVPKGTNVGNFLRDDGTWASVGGGGDALVANPLSQFAATTSLQLAGVISDETGSGALVFANSPTLVTPVLGAATATSINGLTITSSTGILSVANGKTLTSSNTLTLAGTDGSTLNIGAGGTLGTAAFTNATAYAAALGADDNYVTDAQLIVIGNTSGTNTGDQTSVTGNAGTATALQTARTINGVSFDGTADITVAAAAGTLTGATLASNVLNSSLTSVGTLANLTVTNPITGSISGNAGTVTDGVYTTGSYSNPSWITGLAWSKISGTPTTLSGYGITDSVSSSLADGKILVGNGSGIAAAVTPSGDVTISNTGITTIAANAVTALKLQNAAADLGAADVTVNFGNTNGSFNTNITTDGTITATTFVGGLTGDVTGNVSGSSGSTTGNAATATALAANPTDCGANSFATTIAANGNLTCASISDSDVPNNITVDLATLASTATALATPRTIGGVSFDGTSNITVASATGGFAISGGNLTSTGSGQFGAAAGTNGQITLTGSTSGTGIIKVNPTAGAGIVFQLPSANGSNGNVLTTDGAGVTSWTSPATGTVTAVSVTTANGVSASSSGGATPALTFTLGAITPTTVNGITFTGSATPALDVTGTASVSGTNTGDQTSVSGNAGTATALATPRAIYGNNFDGTAALTQIIASNFGGTGNGFTKFTGPTTAEKTFTLPDASATLLYSGGALGTPSSGVATNLTGTAAGLSIGGNAATVTNATLTTGLTVNTGTVTLTGNAANTSVLTLGAGASSVSGTNTGDQTSVTGNAGTVTFADAGGDTTTFVALGTSTTGSLAPATDAGLTYNATTNALTASTFIGGLTGDVTGNVSGSSGSTTGNAATATALAANPTDCGANTFATTIAANGNLTCASLTDSDVPNNITVDLATLASTVTNATLTTALTVNTGTVTLTGNAANTSVLTLGAGASSISGSHSGTSSGTNTGDQTITLTGDVTGSGTGSFAATIAADSVALGTDTTGNYVAGATANEGLALTGTEGGTLGIALTASGTTGSVASNSGLEVGSAGLTMLKGCSDNQILKYTDAGGWACAADAAGGGLSDADYGDITVSGSATTWTIDAGAVTALKLQSAATDLGAADVAVNFGNTNGAFNTNITTDGTITATTFVGGLTGNASTATALAVNPTDCGANTFATTIAANGNLTCASLTDSDVPNNITVDLATLASTVTNATLTTALTVNTGTVTLIGNVANTSALTIGAGAVSVSGTNTGDQTSVSGNAGTVTFADAGGDTTTFLTLGTSATGSLAPATDAGITYNATTDALTTTTFIGALSGNASTATALAANPTDCGANSFATTIAANGNLTCASLTDSDVPNNITVDLATLASTVTNATLTTGLTVNTGTVTLIGNVANTSVLTLGAGASSISGSHSGASSGTNTGDQTITLTGDVTGSGTGSFAATIAADSVALGTDTTGNYVAGATANGGLTLTGTEGGTLGIALTASGTTGSSSSNSGLEVGSAGLTLLKGCTDNEILKYTDAGGWACAADATGGGGGLTVGGAITSGTANRVLYEDGSNQLAESGNFTYDGTTLSIATASTTASNKALNISQTGATAGVDYGGYFSNTGAATTNVGLYTTASGGTTNLGLNVDAGQVLIGGTTLTTGTLAKLNIVSSMSSNGSTTAIAGIHGEYTINPSGGGTQIGNRFVLNNAPTSSANTAINQIIRTIDNTSLANTVRGLEVVSSAGSNTAGTNTGIRSTGATFGGQFITTGLAGGVSLPAGIYAENTGTTQGDVARFYTGSMTSAAAMLNVYQDTSTFTGAGLLMDMAVSTGTFSGNFLDFKNASVQKFKVTSAGVVSMGLSGTASTNAVCSSLANTTAPTAGTAYEIRDCNAAPAADYAEMYPVDTGIEFGDIVAIGTEMVNTYDTTNGEVDWTKVKGTITRLTKSNRGYQGNVIGIVADNYGDFTSAGHNIKDHDNPMPVALNGRVPVKVSSTSEAIVAGDYITTSDESGKAQKATASGQVIGKALESWSPDSGKATVMVFVEQGYYNGPDSGLDGLPLLAGPVSFDGDVTFNGQVAFKLPPLFNSDTGGFALVKQGDRRVTVTFDHPYIAQPVVNASISFEDGDNVSDGDADALFSLGIESLVVNKSQTGFTILLNKNAPRDIRFSWNALSIKDAKIYESVVEGLVFTPPAPDAPAPDTSGTPDSVPAPDAPAPDPVPAPDESIPDAPAPDTSGTPDSVPAPDAPAPDPVPAPEAPASDPVL